MPLYATVDFECINKAGTWCAYAVMVVEYPSCKVVDFIVSYVQRPCTDFDPHTTEFWNNNIYIYDHILKNSTTDIVGEEFRLCSFIHNLVTKHPDVHFISDNPQMDIRLLDNILCKHHHFPISMRGNYIYYQTICTWSFKQAISAIVKKSPSTDRILNQHEVKISKTPLFTWLGPKHLPLSDCARIIYQYFVYRSYASDIRILCD